MPGEFAAMFFRLVVSLFILAMSCLEAVADSPKTRIDFNQPGRSATYSGVAFVFEQASGDCPEQDGTIVIEKGSVQLISLSVLLPSKPTDLLTGLTLSPCVPGTTFAISSLSSLGHVNPCLWPGHGPTSHHLPQGRGRALTIS